MITTSLATGGTVKEKFRYGAYGESTDTSSGTPIRYTGRYLDAETGLYFYRARFYSAKLGRFLQTDPIGTKDDLNLYTYVGNDPLDRTDPTGKLPDWLVDFSGGVGDMAIAATLGVISVGNTSGPEMRGALGNGEVNTGSWSYTAGEIVGIVGTLGLAEVGKVMSSASEAEAASGTTHSVGSPGVTIPGNPAGARAALEEAGYKGTPSTKRSEAGSIHTLPGKDGKMNVRVMDGSNAHPPRAVTTRAGFPSMPRAVAAKRVLARV